jgi:hypothetical protein
MTAAPRTDDRLSDALAGRSAVRGYRATIAQDITAFLTNQPRGGDLGTQYSPGGVCRPRPFLVFMVTTPMLQSTGYASPGSAGIDHLGGRITAPTDKPSCCPAWPGSVGYSRQPVPTSL